MAEYKGRIFNQIYMRAQTPESVAHSPKALEYKNQERDKILQELNGIIDGYDNNIPKELLKNNMKGMIDGKIAKLEEPYSRMRINIGEMITLHDMDDIMPYVRLNMLRELHTQLLGLHSHTSEELDKTLSNLEKEIEATSKKIGSLRVELENASKESAKALKNLTNSAEYRALGEAHTALGKNAGALEAWKGAKNIVDTSNGDLTKDLETYISTAEKEIDAQNNAIALIQSIFQDTSLDEGKIVAYTKGLKEKIGTLSSSNAISQELTLLCKNLMTVFSDNPFKTAPEVQNDLVFFQTDVESLVNGLNTGLRTFKETIITIKQESQTIHTTNKGEQDRFKSTIDTRVKDLTDQTKTLQVSLKKAKQAFQKKVNSIKPLIGKAQEKAQELGQSEGIQKEKEGNKTNEQKNKKDSEGAEQEAYEKIQLIDREDTDLDTKQRIRINASNLIVRSGPKKSAKPLLTEDKKKAIMLQPGDIVTPILDQDGDVASVKDGPREYIQVTLSNDTVGWIARSDKLRGGYKQEYIDNTFEAGTLDETKSYKLKGDNIRLRTGFSTKADTIDILDNKKVVNIQRIAHESAGDNAPEGSKLQWAQVRVTYKDGKIQKGYIAEQFLEEKAENNASNNTEKSGEPEVRIKITLDKVMSFGELATELDTTIERLNELNGLNHSSGDIFNQGSEFYIPKNTTLSKRNTNIGIPEAAKPAEKPMTPKSQKNPIRIPNIPKGANNTSTPSPKTTEIPTPAPAPKEGAKPTESKDKPHVIVPGDTYENVASQYNITEDDLRRANDNMVMRAGKIMRIPAQTTEKPTAPAKPEAKEADETPAEQTYTVQKGDNLTKIAQEHHVVVEDLKKANAKLLAKRINDQINVGDKLIIPPSKTDESEPEGDDVPKTPVPTPESAPAPAPAPKDKTTPE
ncbi:MAG: LysM peptidoglycan-binding domain-containing protein [Candidatus Gracilibacteria bacterium]